MARKKLSLRILLSNITRKVRGGLLIFNIPCVFKNVIKKKIEKRVQLYKRIEVTAALRQGSMTDGKDRKQNS